MKISKHIAKGTQHKVFCEDFLIDEKLNEKYRLFGVFDGCSSGKDSHFASSFIAKVIVSEAAKIVMQKTVVKLKTIIYKSILSIKSISVQMNIETNELLSTIILMLVDIETDTASIIAIGDGLLSINNEMINIEQGNQPDYLAYHLQKINSQNYFDKFYTKLLKYTAIKVKDITISTDGINSFSKTKRDLPDEINITKYFTENNFLENNKAMLGRKHNILRNKYGYDNLDDIAIIRIKI